MTGYPFDYVSLLPQAQLPLRVHTRYRQAKNGQTFTDNGGSRGQNFWMVDS